MVPGGNATIMLINYTSGPAPRSSSGAPTALARSVLLVSRFPEDHRWRPNTQDYVGEQHATASQLVQRTRISIMMLACVPGWEARNNAWRMGSLQTLLCSSVQGCIATPLCVCDLVPGNLPVESCDRNSFCSQQPSLLACGSVL